MHRSALDDSLRLLLNACAAAALLGLPACAKEPGSDGGDGYNDDYSDCGGGGGWSSQDVELQTPGSVVSLVERRGQVFALLREGALVPVDSASTLAETIPATDLRAWVGLLDGDELVVGDGGQILRLASGSGEWTLVDAGITDDLLGLAADEQGAALAITGDRVLHSSDAGQTWTELEAGSWTGLRRVFRAADQFWLIGDGGQVWTSSDPVGGWQSVDLGTSEDLLDGFENGCSTCVVIVSAETMHMRSSDGSWISLPAPEGQLFVAVGGRHVITDRGIHEPNVPLADIFSVTSLDFTPVAIADSGDQIFVAGSGGELVRFWEEYGGCLGRPWMIDGAATTATLADGQTPAEGWARDGLFEHASVASFARFVGELLALGAPPSLIQAAQAAIVDELEHARLCFELAARDRDPIRPGPLPLRLHPPRPLSNAPLASLAPGSVDFDLGLCPPVVGDSSRTARAGDPVALALAVFDEGCIGESVAAAEAAVAAAESEDHEARLALERIAADERRHAALAWRTLRWLVDGFGEPVRAALRRRLTTLGRGGAEIPARVIAELVRPLARELSCARAC